MNPRLSLHCLARISVWVSAVSWAGKAKKDSGDSERAGNGSVPDPSIKLDATGVGISGVLRLSTAISMLHFPLLRHWIYFLRLGFCRP
jgi:hypothetical protein